MTDKLCFICKKEVDPKTSLLQFRFNGDRATCEKKDCCKKTLERLNSNFMTVGVNSPQSLIVQYVKK